MVNNIKLFTSKQRVLVQWTIMALFVLTFFILWFLYSNWLGDSPEIQKILIIDDKAERFILKNGKMSIYLGDEVIWTSPEGHYIDSFYVGDVDNDGIEDLLLSLWKYGSFGEYKPFWHKKTNKDYKNHLFIYRLGREGGGKIRPLWCSSNLSRPIVSIEIKDVDGDGLNEMIVTQGRYKKGLWGKYEINKKAPTETKIWQWQEWGFTLTSLARR